MGNATQTVVALPVDPVVLKPVESCFPRAYTIIGIAFVALCTKLAIAYTTFGSNDAVTFYAFARSLSEHGLKWTYERGVAWLPKGPIFNHPPMIAWFLESIRYLAHQSFFETNGVSFPFLLRLPGILSDFIVVVVLLQVSQSHPLLRNRQWALALLAVSPVSLMISGFHGNTDPIMVLFMVLAGISCISEKPLLCGLWFALSCQVKVIPLLFLPIFFCFWLHRRRLLEFLLPLICVSIVLWWQPLTSFPALFVKNVLSYGSYWGLWGITYCLKTTGVAAFNALLINFSPAQVVIATFLKLVIVLGVSMIAWRRRHLDGWAMMESIALGWILFFVFSPGVCAQYLVWPAPFLLFLSPRFFAFVTATSSVFLFFFYNAICHGLPWYVGVSTNQLVRQWVPWSLLPWAVFVAGGLVVWANAKGDAQPGKVSGALASAMGLLNARLYSRTMRAPSE